MKVGVVNTEDISIIVQGPVVRNKDDYPHGWTSEVLRRIRMHFQGSEIILSTWKGTDTTGLDADIIVLSEDPGFGIANEKTKLAYNVNRQIVSAKEGMKRATRKYAMKMRSDTLFSDNIILSFFGRYLERYEEWKVFKERILTFVARNPRRHFEPKPFLIADWLHFGLREDVQSLWDIPLAPEPETSSWFKTRPRPKKGYEESTVRYAPEQYLWITFLKKFGQINCEHLFDDSPENIRLTEIVIANNLVFLDVDMMGIESLKFVGNKEKGSKDDYIDQQSKIKIYLEDLTQRTLSYNHYQWKQLYKKYCLKKKYIMPHIVYDFFNPILVWSYLTIKLIYKRYANPQTR
jgi:hypothetical protein